MGFGKEDTTEGFARRGDRADWGDFFFLINLWPSSLLWDLFASRDSGEGQSWSLDASRDLMGISTNIAQLKLSGN